MTRDEIMNMPDGREMDALIAREIFGMTIDRTFKGEWVVNPSYYVGSLGESRARGWAPKPYSTDIAAAWAVVEYFAKKYGSVEIDQVEKENLTGQEWCVCLRMDVDFALADTAPLAICRAALLAVMDSK
jgi:hypothetical protein